MKKICNFISILSIVIISSCSKNPSSPTPGNLSFSPLSGPPGTIVTITGKNLSNTTAVTIGGVPAIAISATSAQIVAMVMPGASTGAVTITNRDKTTNNYGNFTVTQTAYPSTQQGAKLVAPGTNSYSYQGFSVAISADGKTAIIASFFSTPTVWIYVRNGDTWKQQGTALATGLNTGLGYRVAINADGNTAIVGSYYENGGKGAACIYTRTDSTWSKQSPILVGSDAVGFAFQGAAVSISADGNTAMVGGETDNAEHGAAWIYTRTNGIWTQQGSKLVGTNAADTSWMGSSVALSADGNTAIIGGPYDNSSKGSVWIFTRNGATWTQQGSKLTGTGAIGASWIGISASLSADGNTAIVGGNGDNSIGAVWVFTRNGSTWAQQGPKLVGTGVSGSYIFQGRSVSISADGNTAIAGGGNDGASPPFQGAVWVYTRSRGVWTQQGSKLVGDGIIGNASFGASVSLSADGRFFAAGGYDDNNYIGATWIFTQ